MRETERLVKKLASDPEAGASERPAPRQDPDIRNLEQDVSERLGAKVTIQHGAKGRGKLVIQYNDLDELDGILEKFN